MSRRAALLLFVACLPLLLRAALSVGLRTSLDVNEGWNAYHALAVRAGAPLYGGQLFMTNYPPLFFYALSPFADPIVAGRVMSLLALGSITCLVVLISRHLGGRHALLAGAVFVASQLLYSTYVGVCDPQLLAHAVACSGLLLSLHRHRALIVSGASLVALSLFVKHNLVALPFTLLVWLWWSRSRVAMLWTVAFTGVFVGGLGLCHFVYGPLFWRDILWPRSYVPFDALRALVSWLLKLSPLLTLTALSSRSRSSHSSFVGLGVTVSLLIGAVQQGGAGVDSNALFECLVFLALAAGTAELPGPRAVRWTVALCLMPFAYGMVRHAREEWLRAGFWIAPRAQEALQGEHDIAFLSEDPNALCDDLTYCYWAGVKRPIDMFNLGQAVSVGRLDATAIVRHIEASARRARMASKSATVFGHRLDMRLVQAHASAALFSRDGSAQ